MIINVKIGDQQITTELVAGHLYYLLSSIPGVQEQLFTGKDEKITFINSFFKKAIKVPSYVRKHKITPYSIHELKQYFSLSSLEIDEIGVYNQLVFVMLRELKEQDILVVETSGLAYHSICYLVKFSKKFLLLHPTKIILICEPEGIGVNYPAFRLEELTDAIVSDFDSWLINLEKEYSVPVDWEEVRGRRDKMSFFSKLKQFFRNVH